MKNKLNEKYEIGFSFWVIVALTFIIIPVVVLGGAGIYIYKSFDWSWVGADRRYIESMDGVVAAWADNRIDDMFEPAQEALGLAETDKQKAAAEYWIGVYYFRKGKYEEAESVLNLSMAHDSANSAPYVTMSGVRGEQKRYDESLEFAKKAVDLEPDYPWAYQALGLAYYHLENKAEAVKNMEKAVDLDPDNQIFRYNLRVVKGENVVEIPGASGTFMSDSQRSGWQKFIDRNRGLAFEYPDDYVLGDGTSTSIYKKQQHYYYQMWHKKTGAPDNSSYDVDSSVIGVSIYDISDVYDGYAGDGDIVFYDYDDKNNKLIVNEMREADKLTPIGTISPELIKIKGREVYAFPVADNDANGYVIVSGGQLMTLIVRVTKGVGGTRQVDLKDFLAGLEI